MSADTGDELPIDRLFGGGIAAGIVVALAMYLVNIDPFFAFGTGMFVAILVAAGGLAFIGRSASR